MQKQKEMEASFQRAHSEFIEKLSEAVDVLERDISETAEMEEICTDEWCQATETVLDDLAKLVYSISEPRWQSKEDSQKIKSLRQRIHDMYADYKCARDVKA
jgi:hypothetical protein